MSTTIERPASGPGGLLAAWFWSYLSSMVNSAGSHSPEETRIFRASQIGFKFENNEFAGVVDHRVIDQTWAFQFNFHTQAHIVARAELEKNRGKKIGVRLDEYDRVVVRLIA